MFRIACYLSLCLLAAAVPFLPHDKAKPTGGAVFPGWPNSFEGSPLRQLPLSTVEQRFERSFPGRMARFSDGSREIVMRWVMESTRKLHHASHCFKASGYSIEPLPIKIDVNGNNWGSFRAVRGSEELVVYKRIYDETGQSWIDVSSWYWAAFWGKSRGPWWAVSVAEKRRKEPAPFLI